MNARELFNKGRFPEAVAAYRQQLTVPGQELAAAQGLGKALMAVGAYSDAIPFLRRVGEYERSKKREALGQEIEISVCEWLCGDKSRGLEIMRQLVADTISGTVTYMPDMADGATQGLLLRYMAVAIKNDDVYQLSIRFLTKVAQSKDARNWPGPVAQFAVGSKLFDDLLFESTGSRGLSLATRVASQDLLKRRQLTNVFFNAAVNERISGNEVRCNEYMKLCSELANPLIEYDWYLARAEVL
jgi:tetratricopeptide (TPR) repeat protein